jgi:hypothetical protein
LDFRWRRPESLQVRSDRDRYRYIGFNLPAIPLPLTDHCGTVFQVCDGVACNSDFGVFNSVSIMHYGAVNGEGGLLHRDDGTLVPLGTSIHRAGPAIASRGFNKLDIFARSSDGRIYWRRWNNGWSGWDLVAAPPFGVTFVSDPAAIASSSERVEVYTMASNGLIYYKEFVGFGWLGWKTAGPQTTDPGYRPAVAHRGNGAVDLYLRGINGLSWHRHRPGFTAGWSEFQLGGEISGAPGAVAYPGPHIDVVAIEGFLYPHAEAVRGVRHRHYPK